MKYFYFYIVILSIFIVYMAYHNTEGFTNLNIGTVKPHRNIR